MVKGKKILCVILSMTMMFCVFPFVVMGAEIVESGKCGENVTYKLDDEGVLTISGEGKLSVNAFMSRRDIKSVIIEYGITDIDDFAFDGCWELKSVTIPNSVTRIGHYAFGDCRKINSVIIPNSVISIDSYAFLTCICLESVTIPSSVTSIGQAAFGYCHILKSIAVDKKNSVYHSAGDCLIETASKKLIAGCNNSVIPKDGSVTIIDDYAFFGCGEINSVTIPNTVISIGKSAFEGCSLKSVTIPNSVTKIGNSAFCRSELVSVKIPSSVTNISDEVFIFCPCLESITVDKQNTVYHSSGNCIIETASKTIIAACNNSVIPDDGTVTCIGNHAFEGCSLSTSITIPNCVTSIGNYAFSVCLRLEYVEIPNSVTSIGNNAFECCNGMTSVIIPNSVERIGEDAFDWCDALKDVFFTGSETEWKKIAVDAGNDKLLGANIHFGYVPGCEHNYTVTTSATCIKDGVTVYTCPTCGFTYSKVTAARDAEHLDENGDGLCDVCGDQLNKPEKQSFFTEIISFFRDFFNSILEFFNKIFG